KPATFDEFKADLTESKCRLVVPEARSGNPAERDIGEARRVAVAALEAEIDRSADGQNVQIPIAKKSRRYDLGQNVDGRERVRVGHQRQIQDILDRASAELRPHLLVFAPRFLFCRMR